MTLRVFSPDKRRSKKEKTITPMTSRYPKIDPNPLNLCCMCMHISITYW